MEGSTVSSSELSESSLGRVRGFPCLDVSERRVGEEDWSCSFSSVLVIRSSIDVSLELTELKACKMSWLGSSLPLASMMLESFEFESLFMNGQFFLLGLLCWSLHAEHLNNLGIFVTNRKPTQCYRHVLEYKLG